VKKDHRAEVFALSTVLRAVVEDFAAQAKNVPEDACAALAAVDAWLQGGTLDAVALQTAADRSFQTGIPRAQREPDRALGWLRTAAGNLAWLAKKDRGWQTGSQAVLDAASYALSSLGSTGIRGQAALEALHAHALANAPASKRQSKKDKPLRVDLSAQIGQAANRRLARRHPLFDPKRRGDEAQLRALLAEKKYAVHQAVLAYDARYGGLVAANAPDEEGHDWIFGAYACLRSDAHVDPRGDQPSWVPVAYSPNDEIYFIDDQGAVWVIDTVAADRAIRFADHADGMMRRVFG
jgi:hypothetical protein